MPWARTACASVLALTLGTPASAIAAPDAPVDTRSPRRAPQGETGLVLGPATAGSYEIRDADGALVATVAVRPDEVTSIATPPGRYAIIDEKGAPVGEVQVAAGERRGLGLPGQRAAPVARAEPAVSAAPGGPYPTPAPTPVAGPAKSSSSKSNKLWGAPLASALIPGLGQAINRQPGKAVAIFVAVVGGTLAAVGLWRLRNRDEGTTAAEPGASRSGEAARLGAFTLLTSGVGMLYLGQIFDAHAKARGRPVEPNETHVVAFELARFSSIGLSPGEPSYALYDDFNLSLMGQVFPRLSVGVSDLGFKLGPDQFVMQGGVRAMGRVYDGSVAARRGVGPRRLWVWVGGGVGPRRLWLSVGGGVLLQGITRDQRVRGLAIGEETVQRSDRSLGSAVYGQLEGRYFFLDRWSLGLAPRVSLPLSRRAYPRGRQLPRLATTFELGAFVGVHL